jgi:autotransporter-associated beta strand protein
LRLGAACCSGLLFLVCALSSFAQTDVWTANSGGWSHSSHWSLGSPANDGSADVSFDVTNSFRSTVNASWSVDSLSIGANAGAFTLKHHGQDTLTIGASLTDNSANSALINVTLLGTMSLNLLQGGTLTLEGSDAYTGATRLAAGMLADSNANTFSPNSAFKVGTGSTLDVDFDETVASLGDNSGGGHVVIAGGATLTMDGSASGAFSGAISGAGGIEMSGAHSLTLTGDDTYLGPTTIGAGSTIVAGSDNALGSPVATTFLTGGAGLVVAGGVTVGNPLSLSGSANRVGGDGTIASPLTVNSAVVLSPRASPGGGPGNLSFGGALTLDTGGAISFDLFDATGAAGTGFSLITANGGLALSAAPGSLTFELVSTDSSGNAAPASNFNAAGSYSWKFATSTTAISGFSAGDFNLDTSGFANATNGGTFSFIEAGDSLYLNFTPVPEPSTWAMMAAGIAAALARSLLRRRPA